MDFSLGDDRPDLDELVALYAAVGWTAYTDDPGRLHAAVLGSHLVLTARSEGGELVGLVRTVSDGCTIAYVQDLLVAPSAQRAGVGAALLGAVLERVADIRQVVLLTDAEPGQRAFYESCGFTEAHDVAPSGLRSFVRFAA
ncbi:acetyltransferase (GNAT) family protein [Curtobacterium sp. PhB130]|uniref:GNAT family N-acetyltransferase n=1 Tax=unclassified Curtobacterium TaxID=257496 RepID=UPI000F4B964A|nr:MULTISPECIES: GNAT family N-acetyltransferase [unclassified Curtobacterium]ROP63821.1 acetyltransferase (GNAT) family protein [Curtobacterium sp. ZW137]ROS78034.1 acetyltransferase (GNAT) family protein [Curtobacterium sp. PhB130]TCK65649.1 acetyltransferase (GNAT) family protein [Curtobacterium sp. PhB136]